MNTKPPVLPEELRQRAEALFQASEELLQDSTTPEETSQLFHELRVHQIQLEMQNEELRCIQAELDASQARYFDLYDLAPIGYLTFGEAGLILEANISAATMFGVARDKLIKQPITRFLCKADQDLFYLHRQQIFTASASQVAEMLLKRPDGSTFWAHIQATPAAGGECWIALSDISERKRAEEKLASSERFLKTIIDTEPECIKMLDSDCNLTMMNRAGLEIIEADSLEQVQGLCVSPLITEPYRDAFIELTRQVFKGVPGILEFEIIGLKGRRIWLDTHAVPFCNEQGKIISLLGITRDITDRKEAENKLLEAKAAAEAANSAKSQFLSTMSHEIRTPMNSVLGVIQLLQQTKLTSEQRELTGIAISSGIKLVDLLNDILDLAKIEAGKMELEITDFDLPSMISDTINILTLQARAKGIQLISSHNPDVPAALKGDAGRLRQIIINLVGNALKFTPQGSITLHIQKESEDDKSLTLRFLIQDSGIGIAAEKLDHVFESFTQADGSTTRIYGGTGLGLAICKQLVELMGGTIGVESVDGTGSMFWFTVVVEKQQSAPLSNPLPLGEGTKFSPLRVEEFEAPSPGGGGVGRGSVFRLLLTEDEPIAQKVVPRLLKSFGYLVDVAGNGTEALALLEKNDYALVLMDCMMPEMNGFEVTAVIRDPASAVLRHDIPVIALTGNAMKQDRERCIAAGMNDHIPKPLLLPDLLALLEKWLKR
jgi:PAS domain S-box-containing protein